MRIAIVNDVLLAVEALRRVVTSVPDYTIAWVARHGAEAVEKCAADTPDLILMDLIMPGMDGVEATRQIMAASPCLILVVTATVSGNMAKVFAAMGYGVRDVVHTPVLGSDGKVEGGAALLDKIAILGKLLTPTPRQEPQRPTRSTAHTPTRHLPPLVAIGASTGGPAALACVLSALPAHFPAALVIIQHVDVQFAAGLADWLQAQTALPVRHQAPAHEQRWRRTARRSLRQGNGSTHGGGSWLCGPFHVYSPAGCDVFRAPPGGEFSRTCGIGLDLVAQPRIEVSVAYIRQRLGYYGHAHSHHSAGFDQIDILIQGCLQEEGTKTFVGKEELDHNDA